MSGTDVGDSRLLFALIAASILLVVSGTVLGAVVPGAAVGRSADKTANHTDPARISGGSDLSALERQMAGRLAERARSGSLNISREDTARARDALGDSQYESLLNEYADVAEETGQINRSRAFRAVRSDQIALTSAVGRYWQLYGSYQSARNGTLFTHPAHFRGASPAFVTTPEQYLARQLEQQWQQVKTSRTDLVQSQRELESLTEQNVTASMDSVNESVREINRTQQTVRDEQFVRTDLSVRPSNERISFSDPLVVEGRLTTASGAPITNDSVEFAVGNQTIRTPIDSDGRFSLRYRPTTVAANTSSVTIRYRPGNGSIYLADERTVPVTIDPVQPNVTVDVTPSEAGYNETISVAGVVGADNGGAGNVSYLVTADEQVVARNRTARNGSFRSNVAVPASVADGNQPVRVFVPSRDRALRSANRTTTMTIAETPTTLPASATSLDGRTIRVSGSLLTDGGVPVRYQDVSVIANGTRLGTVSTGPNGTFEQTLTVPESVGDGGLFESILTLGIDIRYDGTDTNLGSATTQGSVRIATPAVGVWVGGALALVAVLGGLVVVGRKLLGRRSTIGPGPTGGVDAPTLEEKHTVSGLDTETLLDTAWDRLETGESETAARIGYLALRQQLTREFQATSGQTPWEFYQACRRVDFDEPAMTTLQRATELYERARFASTVEAVSGTAVEDALTEISALIRDTQANDQSAD